MACFQSSTANLLYTRYYTDSIKRLTWNAKFGFGVGYFTSADCQSIIDEKVNDRIRTDFEQLKRVCCLVCTYGDPAK